MATAKLPKKATKEFHEAQAKRGKVEKDKAEPTLTLKLDKWQEEVLATEGNLCLRCGRQRGKSTICALKCSEYALDNPGKLIMVIGFVERQANLLFSKILNNIHNIDKKQIQGRPTKHIIELKNGSTIHCYAAGETGFGLMGFSIDLLIADEAAWIAEEVWNSVTPALAVTRGDIWLLSTPRNKSGYYYNCFTDPTFTSFHVSSENCDRIPKEFLEQKKKEFSKKQYAQMYLAEWTDDDSRVFSNEWIDKVCVLDDGIKAPRSDNTALGIDVAGMGDDESTFEGLEVLNNNIYQFHHDITTKTRTTDTIDKILRIDGMFNFWKIGIDDGGMGVGVFDHLLINDQTSYKVIGLNNSKRIISKDGRTSKLQKEAMYMTTLALGEQGKLRLFDTPEIRQSLESIQVEDSGRITGRYSHIVEGVIRAVELLKELNDNDILVYSIKV